MTVFEFAKAYRKTILLAGGVVLMCFALIAGAHALGSAINEQRIGKLETEKQAALKQVRDAHSEILILQGEVKAKDETIKTLTSQIAESNQRVMVAHSETQSARVNYEKVRTDKPHFNSADDAGRVVELGSDLQRLYSDTP